MKPSDSAAQTHYVGDLVTAMERLAPVGLAQDWDNVGLLAGDPASKLSTVMLCIDLTPRVADEAVGRGADLILSYHPPIFKPILRVRADSNGVDAVVFRCLRQGLSLYATHTALDAADGGTNDVIGDLIGLEDRQPLVFHSPADSANAKIVVFVPPDQIDRVAEAMFAAGAGHIGEYSHCGFRVPGRGTFYGGMGTKPAVGQRGRLENVEEIRIETVVPQEKLAGAISAMVRAHPYEEPAFDVYRLAHASPGGIGRVGRLSRAKTVAALARKLQRATHAPCVQIVGPRDREVDRVVILVGAAGSTVFAAPLTPNHVVVTGEIRHHEALTIDRYGATAIALGHFSSERPVLASLANRLRTSLPGVEVLISEHDREPFAPL